MSEDATGSRVAVDKVFRFEVWDFSGTECLSETDYVEVAAAMMAGWATTGRRVSLVENRNKRRTDRVVVAQ